MNILAKQNTKPQNDHIQQHNNNRDRQLLNILCNVTILLMASLTEAFSEIFSTFSKEILSTLTTNLGTTEQDTKEFDDLQKTLPATFRDELLAMKKDISNQMNEKRTELGPLLADPLFNKGITIVEHSPNHLPRLTEDLSERSLLTCLVLLQANDPAFTTMFQELLEWMKKLPLA